MKIIKANPGDFIVAGQQGEELARRVEFDIAEWERLYGPGTVQLLVKRMTDETFYPVAIEQEQGVAVWNVTVPETSVAGKYHTYELRYYAGETLAKAVGGLFSINEAFVGDEGDVPEVHQGWVEQVIATGAESLASQKAAEAARDGAIEAQLNANLANTEAQTAKQEAANYAESALKAESNAKEYAKNAKSSEVAAVKAAEEAENSERNAIVAARQAELSKDGIVQAETNASQYAAAAAKSAADASASASSAKTFMAGAETARGQAQTSAQAASNFSGRAEESAETAKTNAEAAKAAADSVAGSEQRAEQFAIRAEDARNSIVDSEKNTKADAESADKSAFDAKFYADNAQTANVAASGHAIDAGVSRTNAQIAANSATDSANFASSMATKAEKAAKKAEEAALRAGGVQSVNGKAPDENGNVEIVAGVQSDWSQNDPAALDYVKNRTHYETKEVVEILPECTMLSMGGTGFVSETPIENGLVVGEKYIVNWNGVEYSATAHDMALFFQGVPTLINDGADIETAVGGVFAIQIDPNGVVEGERTFYAFAQSMDGSTELTLSIRQEQTTIVPLPAKYLPKGVPYVGEAEVPFDFTFDGDTTGKEVIEVYEGVGYVKVADIVLTRDDLTNAVMTMMSADEEIIYEFDLESIIDVNGDGSIFGGGEGVLAVQRDSEMSGLAFAPGLYFINYPGVYLVKSLIKEGATITEEVINKLDSRCLPTDATELYLTSPGGKKFKITVSDAGTLSATEV